MIDHRQTLQGHPLMIDHRQTLRGHPQADSLAQRMVQIIKKALRKYWLSSVQQTPLGLVSPLDCYGVPHELPSLPGRLLSLLPAVWPIPSCWVEGS
jgi:hypothetical protein